MPKTLWLRSRATHPFQLPDGRLLEPGQKFELPTEEAESLQRHPLLEVIPNPRAPKETGDNEKSGDQ